MKRYLPLAVLCLIAVSAPLGATAQQLDSITIPHDTHFDEGVDCATCHEGVADSAQPGVTFYPDMDVCSDCHDVEDDATCSMCHTNVDEAGTYDRGSFGAALFAHAPHTGRGIECSRCHGAATLASPVLPGKPDCRGCHETAEDYADCGMCHGQEFQLRPFDHGQTWISLHGSEARFNDQACAQCHSQTTCQECHAGDNVRPRSHDLNYAFNHALDARGNSMECVTCHGEPEYCSSCHAAERVLPSNHSEVGWVSMAGGGQHATEGLFDIESCIACHSSGSEEPSCAQCHGR
jgi:hypothetical protein